MKFTSKETASNIESNVKFWKTKIVFSRKTYSDSLCKKGFFEVVDKCRLTNEHFDSAEN